MRETKLTNITPTLLRIFFCKILGWKKSIFLYMRGSHYFSCSLNADIIRKSIKLMCKIIRVAGIIRIAFIIQGRVLLEEIGKGHWHLIILIHVILLGFP